MDREAWRATVHEGSPWGLKESDMTEQLHMRILTNKKVISIKKKKLLEGHNILKIFLNLSFNPFTLSGGEL